MIYSRYLPKKPLVSMVTVLKMLADISQAAHVLGAGRGSFL